MKISELMQKYAEGRDKIAELKREFEAKEKEIKEYMDKIAVNLYEHAQSQGLDKLCSKDYTMYWVTHNSPRITNTEEFIAYVIEHQRFDLLERRVAKLATMAIIKEGEIIPGIEVYSEIKPNLRKIN